MKDMFKDGIGWLLLSWIVILIILTLFIINNS